MQTNERARELQSSILSMANRSMTMQEEDSYERLCGQFASALRVLPVEGKQLSPGGFLIPWRRRLNDG